MDSPEPFFPVCLVLACLVFIVPRRGLPSKPEPTRHLANDCFVLTVESRFRHGSQPTRDRRTTYTVDMTDGDGDFPRVPINAVVLVIIACNANAFLFPAAVRARPLAVRFSCP